MTEPIEESVTPGLQQHPAGDRPTDHKEQRELPSWLTQDTTRKDGPLYLPEHVIAMTEQRLGGEEILKDVREVRVYNGVLPCEIEAWNNGSTHERIRTIGDDFVYKNGTVLAIAQFSGPRRRREYQIMLSKYVETLRKTKGKDITIFYEDKDNDPRASAKLYQQYAETLTDKIIELIGQGEVSKPTIPSVVFNVGNNSNNFVKDCKIIREITDNYHLIQLLTYNKKEIVSCNGLTGDLIYKVLDNILAAYNARAEQTTQQETQEVHMYITVPGPGFKKEMKLHDIFIPGSSKEQSELKRAGIGEVVSVHNTINDIEARRETRLNVYYGTTVDVTDPYQLQVKELMLPAFSSSFLDNIIKDTAEIVRRAKRSYHAITPRLGIVGYVTSTPLQTDFDGRQTSDLKGRENATKIILSVMNNYQK